MCLLYSGPFFHRRGQLKLRYTTLTLVYPVTHTQGFGQLISAIGGIDARPRDVSKAIKEGYSVGICPGASAALSTPPPVLHTPVHHRSHPTIQSNPNPAGGIAEMFWGFPKEGCLPREEYAFIQSRKGFVRMAMKHGVPIVPVYCFGNTHAMHKARTPWILEALSRCVPAFPGP